MSAKFKYIYTQEQYDRYSKISPLQKLKWLEEMNRFLYSFMPQESKALAEKLRSLRSQ